MEKLLYLVWKPEDATPGAFRDAVVGPVAERLRAEGARSPEASLVDEETAALAAARRGGQPPHPAGIVTFWLDCAEARAGAEAALHPHGARLAGYAVAESVALDEVPAAEAPGRRAPGTNVVALLRRPAWLERETWLERWLVDHRAVALETQCVERYVRNVVVRALTESAPPLEGVVEEAFPTDAVLDPMAWYRADGDPEVLRRNLARMVGSVRRFLDLDRVETHPLGRYRLA